jgi:hypothetical protein
VKHEHPGAGPLPIVWLCHVDIDEITVIEFEPLPPHTRDRRITAQRGAQERLEVAVAEPPRRQERRRGSRA